jgi:hypothetical protein
VTISLLYLHKEKQSKIQAMDLKFLGSIKVKMSNIKSLDTVGIQHLLTEEKRLQWLGHVKRMDRTKIPRRALE